MGLVAAVIVAAVVIFSQRRLAKRSMGTVCAVSSVAGTAFALLLAAADGWSRVLAPVVDPTEYYDNLDVLLPARQMLKWFATRDYLVNYSVHLKGHPPGFILVLKMLHAVGLTHPWAVGALSYLGVAMTCASVVYTVTLVAGDATARMVAPFLALAPAAVWMGTSADAFYTGVFATGVALAAHGSRRGGRGAAASLGAGVVIGASLFLSYGTAVLAPLVLLVIWAGNASGIRRLLRLLLFVAGALVVVGAFRAFGFWWFDGLRTTKGLYWEGTAKFRPWAYFVVGDAGALFLAIGPATVYGLTRMRIHDPWLLIGPALAGVAFAIASQYSKGEVERIWLVFMPWITVATSALRPVHARRWLVAHAGTAVILQAWLVSKW